LSPFYEKQILYTHYYFKYVLRLSMLPVKDLKSRKFILGAFFRSPKPLVFYRVSK